MLDLATPSLLFSAISLILLAYTNRFLAYAAVIRNFQHSDDPKLQQAQEAQIKNLHTRLQLTRWMQIFGITSLLSCVLAMFLTYMSVNLIAQWIFGIALILLSISLIICILEINISVKALEIHLKNS